VLRTGLRPSPDDVLIEGRSKENGTAGTEATRIEMFFSRKLIIEPDHGVQWYRDINGKVLHKEPMLPLKEYQLISSDAPVVHQG
jgi:hypothetical protein